MKKVAISIGGSASQQHASMHVHYSSQVDFQIAIGLTGSCRSLLLDIGCSKYTLLVTTTASRCLCIGMRNMRTSQRTAQYNYLVPCTQQNLPESLLKCIDTVLRIYKDNGATCSLHACDMHPEDAGSSSQPRNNPNFTTAAHHKCIRI